MKYWTNFAKNNDPGFSTNNVQWKPYIKNTSDENYFLILDNKKNLKMSSEFLSLKDLTRELFYDKRLNETEKCVILYQMFTFVGNDLYDENIKNYQGKCDRKTSETFIMENASVIDVY